MWLLTAICFAFIERVAVHAQCNWVETSFVRPRVVTGVCHTYRTSSTTKHIIYRCQDDGKVAEELYSNAECTTLTSTTTLSASGKSCAVTSGECEYAYVSDGCGQYSDYPMITNYCYKDTTVNPREYFSFECTDTGIKQTIAGTDSSCASDNVVSTNFGQCDTIAGFNWEFKAIRCDTVVYRPPTAAPTTGAPTADPTTGAPTAATVSPTTAQPTDSTQSPTQIPSSAPITQSPTQSDDHEQGSDAPSLLFCAISNFVLSWLFLAV